VNFPASELPDADIARRIADELGCKLQAYRGERLYAFLKKDSGKMAAVQALAAASGIRLEPEVKLLGDFSA